ncbi:MAG: SHOCT domain-containing protein [Planctomycetota bacterium]|nr:MAG: SHOCT domain-containing protein [Planctomycetota bacterium]
MSGTDFLPYILTVGVMIVLVTAAGIALYVLRGRLFGKDGPNQLDHGGVLETMRAMRDRGEISEEEYRTTQAALVAKATEKRNAAAEPPRGAGPTKTQTSAGRAEDRRARPGFDLTGDPLPPSRWSGSGDDYSSEE